jgi:hypothetical protein
LYALAVLTGLVFFFLIFNLIFFDGRIAFLKEILFAGFLECFLVFVLDLFALRLNGLLILRLVVLFFFRARNKFLKNLNKAIIMPYGYLRAKD